MSESEAERLHGHNYHVKLELEFSSLNELGMTFEFNLIKPIVKKLIEEWDERVLVARSSRLLKVSEEVVDGTPHTHITFQNRRYRFPSDEVVLLEAVNVTTEELARLFAMRMLERLDSPNAPRETVLALKNLLSMECTIEETRGQSACFRYERMTHRI